MKTIACNNMQSRRRLIKFIMPPLSPSFPVNTDMNPVSLLHHQHHAWKSAPILLYFLISLFCRFDYNIPFTFTRSIRVLARTSPRTEYSTDTDPYVCIFQYHFPTFFSHQVFLFVSIPEYFVALLFVSVLMLINSNRNSCYYNYLI